MWNTVLTALDKGYLVALVAGAGDAAAVHCVVEAHQPAGERLLCVRNPWMSYQCAPRNRIRPPNRTPPCHAPRCRPRG